MTYLTWFFVLFISLNILNIDKYLHFAVLSAFLLSIYALGQHYHFDFVQWNPESINSSREFGSLGNPNFLAAYLAMCIPLSLTLSLKRVLFNRVQSSFPPIQPLLLMIGGLCFLLLGTFRISQSFHIAQWTVFLLLSNSLGLFMFCSAFLQLSGFNNLIFSFFTFIILGFGLFSTGSRGGFLGAFLGMIGFIVFLPGKKEFLQGFKEKIENSRKSVLMGGLLMTCFSLVLLLYFGSPFLMRLKDSLFHIGDSLATSRLHIWRPAFRIIGSHPLLGVGLDTFKIAFPFYSGIEFNQIDGQFVSSRTAHNELLQVAATTGLLGLVSYLCVIAFFIASWIKAYRSSPPVQKIYLIGIFSSVIAYHIQNLFSFDVVSLGLLWYFSMTIIGKWEDYSHSPSSQLSTWGQTFKKKNVLTISIISLFILYIILFPLQRLGADIAFSRASAYSDYLKKPDPESDLSALQYYSDVEIAQMKRATELSPLEVKYQLYLGLAYEQRSPLDKNQSKECLLLALESYQKAVNMSPFNAYYYNDQGRVFNALGLQDKNYLISAESAYRKAVQWAPSSPFFLVSHANSLKVVGDTSGYQRELEKAFHLDSSFTSGVLSQMGLQEYQNGQKEKAFVDLNEAIKGNSSNAEAYYDRGLLYLIEKNKSKALDDFLKAKSLSPNPPPGSRIKSLDELIQQSK